MLYETALTLWRRRILTLIAVIAATAAGVAAFIAIKPTQKCTAEVLVLGSTVQPGVDGPVNPFVNLTSSLAVTSQILTVVMSDARTAQDLVSQGYTAKYTVTQNIAQNAGPTLIVTSEDASGAMAQSTLDGVLAEMSTKLHALQDERHISRDLYIQPLTLTSSLTPSPVRKAQLQAAAVATGGVLAAMLLLILIVDRRSRPRTRVAVADVRPSTNRPSTAEESEPVAVAETATERPTATVTSRVDTSRPVPYRRNATAQDQRRGAHASDALDAPARAMSSRAEARRASRPIEAPEPGTS